MCISTVIDVVARDEERVRWESKKVNAEEEDVKKLQILELVCIQQWLCLLASRRSWYRAIWQDGGTKSAEQQLWPDDFFEKNSKHPKRQITSLPGVLLLRYIWQLKHGDKMNQQVYFLRQQRSGMPYDESAGGHQLAWAFSRMSIGPSKPTQVWLRNYSANQRRSAGGGKCNTPAIWGALTFVCLQREEEIMRLAENYLHSPKRRFDEQKETKVYRLLVRIRLY